MCLPLSIECKTYLDKTMLQDASAAAEQIKYRNPNALYIVVAEWLKLGEAVNLGKYKIDKSMCCASRGTRIESIGTTLAT